MILLRSFATIPDIFYYYSNGVIDLRFLPINSFGFFVAMGFLSAAVVLHKELKRRQELGMLSGQLHSIWIGKAPQIGDLIPNLIAGFIVGFKVLGGLMDKANFMADPQNYLVSSQGSWAGGIVLAAAFAGWKYYQLNKSKLAQPIQKEEMRYPHDMVGDMVVIAAIFGVLGANVFELINHPEYLESYMRNPIKSMFSGLTIVGGLFFGIIAIITFAKLRKIPVGHLFDALGPAVMLAYGVGRIGCQVSGDGDWGIANTFDKPDWIPQVLWAQDYAHNVIDNGIQIADCAERHCRVLAEGHFPTPVYETFVSFILFLVLWGMRMKIQAFPGMLFGVYLMMNGVERFFVEFIRVTKRSEFLGITMTQQQFMSILFFLVGAAMIAYLYKKKRD